MKLSFIIPCYGSEHTIESVVREIQETVATRADFDYEIVLVSDASPDGVFSVIKKLAAADSHICGAELSKNFGQHAALMAGFRLASGETIVCLDDDGQTPASECFSLIDKLQEGYDVVFASYPKKKHTLFRNIGSKANSLMAQKLIGKPKDIEIMSYFCCRRFIADEILRYENAYPYMAGLLLRATNRIANVEVCHRERLEGSSGYSLKKLIALWMNGFTAFSIKPLRISTLTGSIFALIGFIYGIITIVNKLFFHPEAPMGYSSLMAVHVFLGGVILLMLGLIGEYIGRAYISLNKSPQYVIRETVNVNGDKNEKADEGK